ncbi:MAG TPA: FlgD immunoglobulin-like domain containing protein, partial [Bacteroidota bacterium]|nr:FlgD immunoglobulin-like domain containing protein [Bacteroidota bacterium]
YMVKYHGTTFLQTERNVANDPPTTLTTDSDPKQSKTTTTATKTDTSHSHAADSVVVQPIPDNMTAQIVFGVPEKSNVRVDIFDGTGNLVRTLINDELDHGDYDKTWDGTDDHGKKLSVGTYFYKTTIGNIAQGRKVIVFR